MKKYISIFKTDFISALAYKWDFLGSLFLRLITLLSIIFMWNGIYNSGGEFENYALSDIIVYLLFSTLIFSIFSSRIAFRLSYLIRTGELSIYLVRPISIIKESFAVSFSDKIINLIIFFGILIFTTILLSFNIINVILGVLMIFFSYIMYFYMLSCISLLGFWLIQMWPLRALYNAIYTLFGGLVIPLSFFGEKISNIFKYNPFSLIGFSISETIIGKSDHNQIILYFVATSIWIVLFLGIYLIGWKKGLRRYEGMGA